MREEADLPFPAEHLRMQKPGCSALCLLQSMWEGWLLHANEHQGRQPSPKLSARTLSQRPDCEGHAAPGGKALKAPKQPRLNTRRTKGVDSPEGSDETGPISTPYSNH